MGTHERRRGPGHGVPEPDRTALYRIAFDAGIKALEDQRDELNGVRTRSVGFTAIMTSGTAFLVGSGLNNVAPSERDVFFYSCAVVGSGFFLLMLGFLAWVLSPTHKFRLILDPGILVSRWIDAEVPGPNESQMLQALSQKTLPSMLETNEARLGRIRFGYLASVLCGSLGLMVWITLVWSRA